MTFALHRLYSFRRCPYAMRARLAIVLAELKVELREIVLKNKPAQMLAICSLLDLQASARSGHGRSIPSITGPVPV